MFVMKTPQRPSQKVSLLWTWLDTSYQVCCGKDERLQELSRSSALNINFRSIYFRFNKRQSKRKLWRVCEECVRVNVSCLVKEIRSSPAELKLCVHASVGESVNVFEMWPGPQALLICNCVWGHVDIPCSSKTCACTWFSFSSLPPTGVSALSKRKQTI